jgi:hypothetical protein
MSLLLARTMLAHAGRSHSSRENLQDFTFSGPYREESGFLLPGGVATMGVVPGRFQWKAHSVFSLCPETRYDLEKGVRTFLLCLALGLFLQGSLFTRLTGFVFRLVILRIIPVLEVAPQVRYGRRVGFPVNKRVICSYGSNLSLPLPRLTFVDVDVPRLHEKAWLGYWDNLTIEVLQFSGILISNRCHMYHNRCFYVTRPTGIQGIPNTGHPPSQYSGSYPHVIGICHQWMKNFYHVLIDIGSVLMAFPEGILSRSIVVLSSIPEYLTIIFEETVHFMALNKGCHIYADNAYVIAPMDVQTPRGLNRLRDFCAKRFGIHNEPPSNYSLFNREKPPRRFSNMNEILSNFTTILPQYPWRIERFRLNIRFAMSLFGLIRVFFAAQGAGSSNIVFMQRGTLLMNVEADRRGVWSGNMTRLLGMHCVFGWLRSMPLYGMRSTVMPKSLIVGMVSAAGAILEVMDKES